MCCLFRGVSWFVSLHVLPYLSVVSVVPVTELAIGRYLGMPKPPFRVMGHQILKSLVPIHPAGPCPVCSVRLPDAVLNDKKKGGRVRVDSVKGYMV